MQTFWRSFGKKGRKTWASLSCIVAMGLGTGACTSGKDTPVQPQELQRVYRATPTVRDMNEQASSVNRKVNIEARPNDPATRTPTERTQRILPGRQPIPVDTASTRAPRDTTRSQ